MSDVSIVKVQLPLFPPGDTLALIYDQGRKHTERRQLTPDERRMMGDALRRYFRAEWRGQGDRHRWFLLRPVKDPRW